MRAAGKKREIDGGIVFHRRVQTVVNRGDFFQIVLQHFFTIVGADNAVHFAVAGELCLCYQALIAAIFIGNRIFDGMTIKAAGQRDGDREVAEQLKTELLLWRATYGMVQARF